MELNVGSIAVLPATWLTYPVLLGQDDFRLQTCPNADYSQQD